MTKLFERPVRKLGFGLMRRPTHEDGKIDMEHVTRMVDAFMQAGCSYFDTAYVYHNQTSEIAAREALVKRYPRDAFQITSKLPVWEMKEAADCERIFQESLERTGVSFFDIYLLHSVGRGSLPKYDEFGMWDFLKKVREDGRARRVGFSFHDDAALLDELLTRYPFVDVVQLQINYADWESDRIQSRKCYETCLRHGKAVIVMEPIKGGILSSFSPALQKGFDACGVNESPAALALRFTASLTGVDVVLSGMSNIDQLLQNLATFADSRPFSDAERRAVDEIIRLSKEIDLVPCTSCGYCQKGCPQKIWIPRMIGSLNHHRLYGMTDALRSEYAYGAENDAPTSACVACGACEGVCPQHLHIIDLLKEVSALFD